MFYVNIMRALIESNKSAVTLGPNYFVILIFLAITLDLHS